MVSLFNLQARPYFVQQAKPSIYRHTRSENLTMAVILGSIHQRRDQI
jgi:hypothetical protein